MTRRTATWTAVTAARPRSAATRSVVCGNPNEHLGSTAIQDSQAIWGLRHVKGPEEDLCSDLGTFEVGEILQGPIEGRMRTVARSYSEELDRELHRLLLNCGHRTTE